MKGASFYRSRNTLHAAVALSDFKSESREYDICMRSDVPEYISIVMYSNAAVPTKLYVLLGGENCLVH